MPNGTVPSFVYSLVIVIGFVITAWGNSTVFNRLFIAKQRG